MTTLIAPPPESTVPVSEPEPAVASPPPPPTLERQPIGNGRRRGGVVGGLILIALGVVALAGNLLPSSGGLLFLGLGAAFLAARVVTGRGGYAVPAGLLLAFGTYVALTETAAVAGRESSGLFFIMLGLGFLASYVIAARPGAMWPILPAAALIGFGIFVQGWLLAWPFEQLVWLAAYWPLALIAFGAWLLLRDQVPPVWRGPLTIVGASGLILVGFLVAAAGLASITAPAGRFMPFPVWPMPMLGEPPIQDSVVVFSPIGTGDTVRLTNSSGRTTVRGASVDQVRVEAIRHYWSATDPPVITLVPGSGTLTVQTTQSLRGPISIDYVIDVPFAAGADIHSSSGEITLTDVNGPVSAESTSGSVRLERIGGELRVASTSGSIRGSEVARLREARSTSGSIDLTGAFATDATVVTTSGSATLRFDRNASVRINASSVSGSIRTNGLGLPPGRTDARSQSVTLGTGAAVVQVRTTSGSIALSTL